MNQINEALLMSAHMRDDAVVKLRAFAQEHQNCVRGWITCPTCTHTTGGRGMHCDMCSNPCPDCVDGMTPSPELVERVARAILDVTEGKSEKIIEVDRRAARAGLLASRRAGQA